MQQTTAIVLAPACISYFYLFFLHSSQEFTQIHFYFYFIFFEKRSCCEWMKSALVCGSQPFSLPPQQFFLLLLLLHPQHLWLGSRRVTAARRAEVDTVVRTVTASRRVARASASAHLVGSNLQGGAGKAAPVCSAAFSSAGKLGCWATSFFFFLV